MESAAKQSLQAGTFEDDDDMKNYLKLLRETIVECYTSIVHGVTTSDDNNDRMPLVKYAPSLLQFLASASDKAYNPSKVISQYLLMLM